MNYEGAIAWMLAVFSMTMVVAGASMAYVSREYPRQRRFLETCSGMLLVLGLIALGFAFPFYD